MYKSPSNHQVIVLSEDQNDLQMLSPQIIDLLQIQESPINQQPNTVQHQQTPVIIRFNEIQQKHVKIIQSPYKVSPWLTEQTAKIKNPGIRFHNEIIDYYNYIRPNQHTKQIRLAAFRQLKELIVSQFPKAKVYPFGSFVTQLYLPDADIDLVVLTQNKYLPDAVYERLFYIIRNTPQHYKSVEFIRGAKVPIIKLIDTTTGINFDISVDRVQGMYQIEYVNRINKTYPEFKYLAFIFKCFLKTRELSDTFKGGVGSFLLFSLIHAYLQNQNRQTLCNCTLGEHVMKFMSFYGERDWSKKVLLIKNGVIEDRDGQIGTFSCFAPQNSKRDIGKAAFRIIEIFQIFKNRLKILRCTNFIPMQSILSKLLNPTSQQFQYRQQKSEGEAQVQ